MPKNPRSATSRSKPTPRIAAKTAAQSEKPVPGARPPTSARNLLSPHTAPLLALAVLILVYLAPVLPPFAHSPRLGANIADEYLPALTLQKSILGLGHLPLWNPYSFGGAPFLADTNRSSLFYPTTLIYSAVPIATAIPWIESIHLFLTASAMYFLMFEYTRKRIPGVFAAIGWTFGTFFASRIWIGELSQLEVCANLPLQLLILERMLLRPRLSRWAVVSGLCFALTVYAGCLEAAFMSSVVVVLRFAAELAHRARAPKTDPSDIASLIINGVVATAVGLGLAAVQLLPALQLIACSAPTDWSPVKGGSPQPISLATLLVPDILGGVAAQNPFQRSSIAESSAYPGVPTLIVAAVAPLLRSLRDSRTTRFYAAIALLALLLAVGATTPLYRLVSLIPGFHPATTPLSWLYVVAFALSVLAGLSIDALVDLRILSRPAIARVVLVAAGATLIGVIAALGCLAFKETFIACFKPQVAVGNAPDLDSGPLNSRQLYLRQVTGVWLFAGFAAATTAALRWRAATLTARHGRGFAIGLIGLLLLDLAIVNHKTIAAVPHLTAAEAAGGDFVSVLFVEAAINANIKTRSTSGNNAFRVLPMPDADSLPNQNLLIGIPSLLGYDPIELEGYGRMLDALPGVPAGDNDSQAPTDWRSPLVDRWNVRYIVTRTEIDGPRLHGIFDPRGVWVYRNPEGDPRAYVVHRTETVVDSADALAHLRAGNGGFPADLAYVTGSDRRLAGAGTAESATGFHQPDPNHLVIEANSHGPGLLVVADTMYPGWTAHVDGATAPVVTVDGGMRGVYLGDGSHRIELSYECQPLEIGAAIAAIALLGAGWVIWRGSQRT